MLLLKILLFILKIIGIVLLAVIGIVLLILCLLLFVPIRYKVHASYYDKPRVSAHVTYLLKLLHIDFELDGKESGLKIKLCGHNISDDEKDDSPSKPAGKAKKSSHSKAKSKPEEKDKADSAGIEDAGKTGGTKISEKTDIAGRTDTHDKPDITESYKDTDTLTDKATENNVRNSIPHTEKAKAAKETEKRRSHDNDNHDNNPDDTDSASNNATDKIKAIVSLIKENKSVIYFVLGQVKLLFKHIMPGSHSIYIKLGLDDPALLGEIIGGISVFRAMTGLVINITPVWDEKVFEAELDFKGRIILGRVLFIAARVYFNKDVKKIIKTIKNTK